MTRRTVARRLSPLVIASAFVLGLAAGPARAQQAASGGEVDNGTAIESGRSFDGYAATTILAGLALFALAKSARR